MKKPMSIARRSELRALAHALKPVVIIGDKGLTDAVMAEIDRSLAAHELVKVKAATDEREARAAWMAEICEKLEAHPVQSIGKILVLWREKPVKEAPEAPAAKPAPARRARKPVAAEAPKAKPRGRPQPRTAEGGEATRTARPRSRTPSAPPASAPPRRRPRTSR